MLLVSGWVCPECIEEYDETMESIFNEFKKKLKKYKERCKK